MLVKDRMTPNPVTIVPEATLPEAFRLMREHKIRHLPVVDEQGKLIGIVTQTDMLQAAPSPVATLTVFEMNYLLANLHIREVMSSPPITVAETAPLEEAAQRMVEKKISCLPVMRDDELVGVITETDIFKAFVEVLGGGEASLRVTVRVPDVRGELARLAGLVARLGGNICSVALFRGKEPGCAYLTFRLEGVEEQALVPALAAEGEHVVHVWSK